MPLANGQTFAGYRILRLLGSGAMGEVYLAQHPRLPRKDALKVLAANVSANAEYRARFAREADLASALDYPHIVCVHDRGDDDGQLWISMQYVDGLDAARLLADKFPEGMPPHRVASIVTAVASALDYAHDRGLLHRDIKPANIMLTDDQQRILLADFGIARSFKEVSSLTATGFTVGTVAYAAPEQLMGQDLDGRADQYALAATAYHLLAGSQMFPHSNPAVVIGRHINATPPSLADTRPELAALDPILAIALSKNPEDRFFHCTNFAHALASAQLEAATGSSHLSQATPPATRTKRPTATRPITSVPPAASTTAESVFIPGEVTDVDGPRSRWPIMVGAIVVMLLLTAVALVLRPWQEQDRAASGNTAMPTSVTPSITFDGMRDFVELYYADLPAHPNDAWAKLDAHCQNQTGLREYLDFWATIQSVAVISVSPRDTTSVVARLKYVRRNGQSDTEDRWFRVILVNGAMLLDESDRTTTETTTTSPSASPVGTFPASSIDTVLLTAAEMSKLLGIGVTDNPAGGGAGALALDTSSYGTSDHSAQVKPQSCVGVAFTAEHDVYGDTGFQVIKTQSFGNLYGDSGQAKGPYRLEQTAVVFPSTDPAQKFLASSQTQWNACANGEVDVTLGFENGRGFRLGSVQRRQGDLLTVSMADNGGLNGAHACQQALGVRANVVVETRTCEVPSNAGSPMDPPDPAWAVSDAEELAKAMLGKVKT
jgi:serine/threonine-protein kinase